MKNYEEMYNALLSYAKKEGLRLIEAELRNEGIVFCLFKDRIVLNMKCKHIDSIDSVCYSKGKGAMM